MKSLLLFKKAGVLAVCLILIGGGFWVRLHTRQQTSAVSQAAGSAALSTTDPSIKFQFETMPVGGENYFVNYRLQREQFRQETKSMLSQLLNSSVETTKAQAQEKWLELSSKIQEEDEIENILKLKGFQDIVSDVNSDSVTIIAYASSLSANEVSLIQEIAAGVTKVSPDKIMISTKE